VNTAAGHEFVLVDAAQGTREAAFDHERLARALSAAMDTTFSPWSLPLERLTPLQDGRGLGFELDRRRWDVRRGGVHVRATGHRTGAASRTRCCLLTGGGPRSVAITTSGSGT
jgi:hypothetical protein